MTRRCRISCFEKGGNGKVSGAHNGRASLYGAKSTWDRFDLRVDIGVGFTAREALDRVLSEKACVSPSQLVARGQLRSHAG